MLERQESTTESRGIVVVEPRVPLSARVYVRVFLVRVRIRVCMYVFVQKKCARSRGRER